MSARGAIRRAALGAAALALLACAWICWRAQSALVERRASQLLLDRRGRYLGEVPGARGELGYWPLPDDLPEKIVRATVETEDRRFFEHRGVDPRALARAVLQDARSLRRISGASTLAMQLARLQTPGARTPWRKAKEMVEALLLVRRHGHLRVLRQYLTVAPYGHRVRGAARAARLYFDKPVEDLSWLQAAFLAGLPQMPGRMDPYRPEGLRRAVKRAHRILRMLRARGVISELELQQALGSNLGLVAKPRREPGALHAVLALSAQTSGARRGEPMRRTTLDLDLQRLAARVLAENLAAHRAAGAGNTAGLVVDPATGEVLAHVGSADYFSAEGHGAIDYARVKRSPGSALKPLLYALALERGRATAATELPDTAMDLQGHGRAAFLPENMGGGFLGPLLLREALGNSRNIPALRVLASVGVQPALQLLESAGVRGISYEPDAYGLPLALGALPVTVEELAQLYGMLARGGEAMPLRHFLDEPAQRPRRVLGRQAAQLVTHILGDELARRPTFPPGGTLDYDYAVAVKTGTSQGFRDAWTAAFSDRLLVVAWLGNHDWRRMQGLSGASAAAGAVQRILDQAMPDRAPHRAVLQAFPAPEGFEPRTICALSGRLAGPDCPARKAELFAPGSEPTEPCPFHARVRLDRRNGLRAGPTCPKRFVRERAMLTLPPEYEQWARAQHLELAPARESPLCPLAPDAEYAQRPSVRIREPRAKSRYLADPDTPAELSTVRLAASVLPRSAQIDWIVDGRVLARVGFPHEARLPLQPGPHTIRAALVGHVAESAAVTIVVDE
jgi:penicillin-binding protein 1C